jgi:hypothetical protein
LTITKNNFSTLQQRNVEFARTWMTGGIELARAYQNLFSPFSYAIYMQQNLKAAEQTTLLTQQALKATEQALKATQQELRVAEEATAKAEKATAKAERATGKAEQDTMKAEQTNAKSQEAIREATLRAEEETREVALQTAVHNSLKTKDYEELNVDEVSKRLDGLSAAELKKVREHEKHNKNRDTLVEQIDRKMKATA